MTAYYNEVEPYAATWLRNLIAAGLIPAGDVDDRSIADVQPSDLHGYTQCHFFAGLGGWAYAARLAGWPDDRPLWTGSCPCQPFSVAGKGRGHDDERHLWPEFYRLIAACRPSVIFGEQVSNAARARDIKGQDVRRVRRAQALQKLLRGQKGQDAENLYRMLQNDGAPEENWYESRALGFSPEMEEGEPCLYADNGGALSSKTERPSLRFGRVETTDRGEDQSGGMRINGPPSESGWGPDLGQSFTGSNRPEGRLHNFQHSDRSVRAQRNDEYVGAEQGFGDCGGTENENAGSRESSLGRVGGSSETPAEPSWFDRISSDLEAIGYSCRASNIPACAVDAPHRRDRLWFVAVADTEIQRSQTGPCLESNRRSPTESERRGERSGALADATGGQLPEPLRQPQARNGTRSAGAECLGNASGTATQLRRKPGELSGQTGAAQGEGNQREWSRDAARDPSGRNNSVGDAHEPCPREGREQRSGQLGRAGVDPGPYHGRNGTFWSDHVWLAGADGKARRVPGESESGIRLLAHGIPARVPKLRALGNAIVPQVAAEVIRAFMESNA